jgi:hypothetical protein
MAAYARAALTTRADSELELIRAETRALNSAFQRYGAYAAAQSAFGRIYNSIGLEVVPAAMDGSSLQDIGASITRNIEQIEKDTFAKLGLGSNALPSMTLQFDGISTADGVANAESAAAIQRAIADVLKRNRMELSTDKAQHQLRFALALDAPANGTRRATWVITLTGADGKPLGETRYVSSLMVEPTPGSMIAFAQAAAISSLRPVNTWLAAAAAR